MAQRRAFPTAALGLWSILPYLLVLRAEVGQPREESLYLWIDAHQARVLIGKAPESKAQNLPLPVFSLFQTSIKEGSMHAFNMFLKLNFQGKLIPLLISHFPSESI